MTIDYEKARSLLILRKSELQDLRTVSEEAQSTVMLDQQSVGRLSRMDALQQQAMAQAQDRARQKESIMIEAALSRIEDGEYGYCADCGEEISEKRLELSPAAALCVRCAG